MSLLWSVFCSLFTRVIVLTLSCSITLKHFCQFWKSITLSILRKSYSLNEYVCLCMCTSMLAHVEARGQPQMSSSGMPSTSFETGSLIGLEYMVRLGWQVSRKNLPVSTSLAMGSQTATPAFPRELCESNSGSHACKATTHWLSHLPSLTEPFPQSSPSF